MTVVAIVLLCGSASACSGDDKTPVTGLGPEATGTCLLVDDSVGAEINDLPTVDCAEEHTHEIYAIINSASSAYPGFEALEAEAQVLCLEAFEPYVGISPFDSNLFYSWIVPTLTSWEDKDVKESAGVESNGDREIICVVGRNDSEFVTGSFEGTRQ
ncbi:MAG: hypothetical protein HOK58_00955 [Acidimicrobiaceae bacterium]|nr:hypothetical protein [Acidimicrobiaceae bacterium]